MKWNTNVWGSFVGKPKKQTNFNLIPTFYLERNCSLMPAGSVISVHDNRQRVLNKVSSNWTKALAAALSLPTIDRTIGTRAVRGESVTYDCKNPFNCGYSNGVWGGGAGRFGSSGMPANTFRTSFSFRECVNNLKSSSQPLNLIQYYEKFNFDFKCWLFSFFLKKNNQQTNTITLLIL